MPECTGSLHGPYAPYGLLQDCNARPVHVCPPHAQAYHYAAQALLAAYRAHKLARKMQEEGGWAAEDDDNDKGEDGDEGGDEPQLQLQSAGRDTRRRKEAGVAQQSEAQNVQAELLPAAGDGSGLSVASGSRAIEDDSAPVKRRRGRPWKQPVQDEGSRAEVPQEKVPKKRGRPKKKKDGDVDE